MLTFWNIVLLIFLGSVCFGRPRSEKLPVMLRPATVLLHAKSEL